ncbi:hypothetical protein [Candidatus Nitrotoga sp. 1052]|uniref:hypothetical protein n=1 Tax=Candidatus Nitrotoga sp. 1052 TaxID=2886964 RepID=UPI001EF57AD8|nr:hypothetical protein [Candidatus Nitrotoga sp. 1052]CAH1086579.1 hypothetical protein NTG1052_570009 [Candidatus Nitrotoga sp. 1052]
MNQPPSGSDLRGAARQQLPFRDLNYRYGATVRDESCTGIAREEPYQTRHTYATLSLMAGEPYVGDQAVRTRHYDNGADCLFEVN